MAHIFAEVKEGKIPDIYIQDFSKLEPYEKEIKQWFGEGIGFIPYVGIHVRRGDYVGNSFYCQLWDIDYYEKAIALFPAHKKFLVFSDDLKWCKEKFKDEKFQVIEGGTELEDFNMLASCESQICANSSFSIWAAYLNQHWGKTVVAPSNERWFTDKQPRVVLPKTWIRI